MLFDQKRKIQWIRIFLAIFYVFMLSKEVGLVGEGIVKAVLPSKERDATLSIVVSAFVIAWAGLALFAILHDKRVLLLISGIILIAFCMLIPVMGVLAIVVSQYDNDPNIIDQTKEILVEYFKNLVFDIGAIWATFVLVRHLKTKDAPAATQAA